MSTPTEPLSFETIASFLATEYADDYVIEPAVKAIADALTSAYQRGLVDGAANHHCESYDGSAPECWSVQPTVAPSGQSEQPGSRDIEERP